MKTFIGARPNRKRYTLALAGAMLLIAMPAWSVTPVEVAKLLADDGATNDFFGFGVALSGDTAVIGAPTSIFVLPGGTGSAYVFNIYCDKTPTGMDNFVEPSPVDEKGDPVDNAPAISYEFDPVGTSAEVDDLVDRVQEITLVLQGGTL